MSKGKRHIKYCREDKIYYRICYILVMILTLLVLYPIVYVVSASLSSGSAVTAGRVWLLPVDFTLRSYEAVFKYKNLWIGYRNTIFYTASGTLINVAITLICAYPLSRKNLRGKPFFDFLFMFTMIFNGGMIPGYMLVRSLHMLNTIWAMIIPGALSVYNMIVVRTFFQTSIPPELLEASKIDGCNDVKYFFQIILPLSKAVIAVITLWYAVGHWNSYFRAFLYLTDKQLYPVQIFLKEILVQNQVDVEMVDPTILAEMQNMQAVLKYSMIVISSLPVFCFYPFAQKYFVKGVMIGSVKG